MNGWVGAGVADPQLDLTVGAIGSQGVILQVEGHQVLALSVMTSSLTPGLARRIMPATRSAERLTVTEPAALVTTLP